MCCIVLTTAAAGPAAFARQRESVQSESTTQRIELDTKAPLTPSDPSGNDPSSTAFQSERSLPISPIQPVVEEWGSGPILWLAGLALLPFAILGATSFVKISIVLSLLRNALGTPQVPSDTVLAGIALILSAFVMAPVIDQILSHLPRNPDELRTVHGVVETATLAIEPVRSFLQRNTRREEIALFVELSKRDGAPPASHESLTILLPSFITSQLREAFIAGFVIFVPFLVVDLVIANVLMSMGMVMVSPTTVALPIKIMLFILIDGWPLLLKGLALSYH